MIKRLFDILASAFGLVLLSPVIAVVAWQIRRKLGSPVLFRQVRPGLDGKPFEMIKFRTMRDAMDAQGNPLPDSERMTPFGQFLRSTSLDELPELWNVLKGDMSLVGPRPCLFNQTELIKERAERGVFAARPGITGLAQINGIDMSTPKLLAETDARMLQDLGLSAYFTYIIKTVTGAGRGDRIRQE